MKKIVASIALAALCGGFVACDTDYEPLDLQPVKKYSEQYYQNLRDYKSNMFERSICFVWFADYNGDSSSPAYRFSALPDSVDICSLWGGYPDPVQNKLAYKEMWEMRRKKGTLLVAPTIIRIMENENYANFGLTYEDMVNQKTTIDPKGEYPDWCVLYGNHLLQDMWDNGIDGLDLDYEPESQDERDYGIYGKRMSLFVKYLGQFIGPKGEDKSKLLIIDGHTPPTDCEPYINYMVRQNYGNTSCSKVTGFPWEKCIYTENIGDYWTTGGGMESQAAYQPAEGYKGGFGAFMVQRDYHTVDSGSNNQVAYGHLRRGIQLQNPAIVK
ncbi:glycoside hydrolase family 18 [Alistipes sp.]|uniref:glycoside hydrolase family 18 n=1 Tax=Alistipes sp. TaxID=1872444 RepID=UPI003AF02A34